MSELTAQIGHLKVEVHRRDHPQYSSNDGSVYAKVTNLDGSFAYLEEKEVDEVKRLMSELKRISDRH
jgi:hypothetical protein